MTVIAGAASLVFIVYRLTRIAVGLQTSSLGEDVGMPLAILVVSVVFLAYHLYWIRNEQGAEVEAGDVVREATAVETAEPAHELVVVGPAGADLEALRAALAERLPDGFSIVVRPREGAA